MVYVVSEEVVLAWMRRGIEKREKYLSEPGHSLILNRPPTYVD